MKLRIAKLALLLILLSGVALIVIGIATGFLGTSAYTDISDFPGETDDTLDASLNGSGSDTSSDSGNASADSGEQASDADAADDPEALRGTTEGTDEGLSGTLDGLIDQKVEPAAQPEKLGDTWDSYTVEINGTLLALPCRFDQLKAAGLELDTELTDAKTVGAQEYVIGYMKSGQGDSLMVDLINPDNGPKRPQDCLVAGITVSEYDMKGGLSVVFPGNIRLGDSSDDVLAKLGEPTEDVYSGEDLKMYTWADYTAYYSAFEADFSTQSGKLSQVYLKNYGF